jgi:hypothetical protein
MARNRWENNFERNENAYRIFLTKFIDKPIFDNYSIGTALQYTYNVTMKSKRLLRAPAKIILTELIVKNKKKILTDLETLKVFPQSTFVPLLSDISLSSFDNISNPKIVTAARKRQSDDDLTNIICKKLKLSTSDSNDIKCASNKRKVSITK